MFSVILTAIEVRVLVRHLFLVAEGTNGKAEKREEILSNFAKRTKILVDGEISLLIVCVRVCLVGHSVGIGS